MKKDKIFRLNLEKVDQSLLSVENNWAKITKDLIDEKIGEKDTKFKGEVRDKVFMGYKYLDNILAQEIPPFEANSYNLMLELNNIVHYGDSDLKLRHEYQSSIKATSEKFVRYYDPICNWYEKHKKDSSPTKLAAEVYVAILGQPQLFIEGNHRTGNLIANWILMHNGHAPFVLNSNNAIAYFKPSSEIKYFTDKTSWRSMFKLPKYRKSFKKFLEEYSEEKYILK